MQPIRCAITFHSVEEFRAAVVDRGGPCFVPWPEDIPAFTLLDLDVSIEDARLEIRAQVVGPDFDDIGNVGLAVELDRESLDVVAQFDAQLKAGAPAPALFATTRMKIDLHPAASSPSAATMPPPVPWDGTSTEKLPDGHLVDGRFRIERHLATGGMGEVYRAEHVHLKRPVALKMLRKELSNDSEMWGRFEREAQLVSQLENPHVVRVFDFGRTSDGHLFLAMEFVEGDTLDKRLQDGGPFEPRRAVEVITQVLDGLAEAHNLGVVHRDLKPPNIMLGARREGGERAKILDFGIARLSDASRSPERTKLTQVGVVVGTPAYLAPEQALADELDHRTDIYAMGCVTYEVLTGRPPFIGGDLRKVISQHLTAAPENPALLRPELAKFPALCAAVLKALAKEKEHRFQNVLDFREALRRSLSTSPSQEVAVAELVPDASAPWPPAEWAPAPAPVAQQPPPPAIAPMVVVGQADDFFSATGGVPHTVGAASGGDVPGLTGRVPPELIARLAPHPAQPTEAVMMRVEILGPAPRSPAAATCLAHVTDLMARAGAFFMGADDEGVTFGLSTNAGSPAGRAAQVLVATRDVLVTQSAQLQTSINLRALALPVKVPAVKEVIAASRLRLAKARANSVWIDQRLAPALGRVCEVVGTTEAGMAGLGARKARKRSTAELIARKPLVDAFERRLAGLANGVGAPLIVSGPSGSGHTSLSILCTALATKKGALAVMASGHDAPWGALVELMCGALGFEPHDAQRKLAAALKPLPIVDAARNAAMALAGLNPMPSSFSPGQAAHAVRVVVRAAAIDRPVVMIADGLQSFDRQSREAFFAMVSRPASRELLLGFGTPQCIEAQQAGTQVHAIAPFGQAEMQRLLTVTLSSVAGARLTQWMSLHSEGVPAAALDLLTWLDERGMLFTDAQGAVELAEPEVKPPMDLAPAVLDAVPQATRQTLVAAALLGERFEQTVLKDVVPAADEAFLMGLMSCGFLTAEPGKRPRLRDHELRHRLASGRGTEADALRRRCAEALIARGRVDAGAVDPVHLARLLAEANEGARAAPLWKHALDSATARRDFRGARDAWVGLSRSLASMTQPDGDRIRVEALSRAAALCVLLDELTEARMYLNEAAQLVPRVMPPSAEHLLIEARVLRLEGRRVKAAELLATAEAIATGSPVHVLILAERGEAREVEGDLDGSMAAFELALSGAAQVADFARWHGEVELHARLEARLATICFARRDAARAKALLESSLARWRKANWPWAEARVLSTLGTVLIFLQQFGPAAQAYEAAGQTAARGGDLLFQARAMIQQAKAIRKLQGASAAMRNVALEARKICLALGWEQGRADASALVEG
ncbi:MAG: protein kinase [Archangium sp.]